jgi:hypothetical protein
METNEDVIITMAKKKAIQKATDMAYTKHYKQLLIDKPEEISKNTDFLAKAEQYKIQAFINSNKFPVKEFPLCFITISPAETLHGNYVDWNVIRPYVDKFIDKVFITEAIWTYEQRGATIDEVKGFHVHILIARGNKHQMMEQNKLDKAIRNHFSKLWEKNPDFKQLNVKFKTSTAIKDIVNYCKGIKKDDTGIKQAKVEIDKLLRKEYELDDIYCKGEYFKVYID